MAVTLSIRNVPDALAEQLRIRAKSHHRSLQGELMVLLETSLWSGQSKPMDAVLDELHQLGLSGPDEATAMVREDRDRR
jgi:plasmid stability protein